MEHLQWGIPLLELFFRRRQTLENGAVISRLRSAIDLLAGVLSEENFDQACMTFVTGIAAGLVCDRVSLGFVKQRKVSIQAISHSALFDKRTSFIRSLAKAMDEAILQGSEIIYPQPPDSIALIVRNHEKFAEPIRGEDDPYRSPLRERALLRGPDAGKERRGVLQRGGRERLQEHLRPRGPGPGREKGAEPSPRQADVRCGAPGLKRLVGAGHTGTKLLPAPDRCADRLFQPRERRIPDHRERDPRRLGAPNRRGAFQRVHQGSAGPQRGHGAGGSVMCTLDERDLRLEKTNLAGQESQLLRQHQEAVALHDRAKANVIKAQLDQVIAQLDLTDIKLQRTTIRAPFDGLVLSGRLKPEAGIRGRGGGGPVRDRPPFGLPPHPSGERVRDSAGPGGPEGRPRASCAARRVRFRRAQDHAPLHDTGGQELLPGGGGPRQRHKRAETGDGGHRKDIRGTAKADIHLDGKASQLAQALVLVMAALRNPAEQKSLFSESWYRVASLRPRLRSHTQFHHHVYRETDWYILQDNSTGRFHRFSREAYAIVGLMDGKRSMQEIWEAACERLGDDMPTQGEVISLLSYLHQNDALQSDKPPDISDLAKRQRKEKTGRWIAMARSPAAMSFPIWDPDSFLDRSLFLVRPLPQPDRRRAVAPRSLRPPFFSWACTGRSCLATLPTGC